MANPENLSVPPTIGRYRLYGIIAAGGMATVHYGRMHGQLGFARTVAVKRLHREYARDPEFVAMFMDEARLAVRVHHPNVVETLDVFAADGELFLVMEYVPAVSLSHLLRAVQARGELVPPPVAAAIVAHILLGLHAAHEATDEAGNPLDIVHRDVSPQNILVGADGCARVLDFGIAKASGRQQVTREGLVKGKLAYMSPEQITNVFVTRQSDVFAASIVLWEALTRTRLFQADSESSVLARVLSAPIEPPSAIVAGLAPELDAIVLRGLTRDLSGRYATAREMSLELETRTTLATASQVSEWVERLAGDELAERAAHVARIESESRAEPMSVTTVLGGAGIGEDGRRRPNEVQRPTGQRDRRLLALLAAALLSAAGLAGINLAGRVAPLRAAEPRERSSTPVSALASSSPPAEALDPMEEPVPSALARRPISTAQPRVSKSKPAPSATTRVGGSGTEPGNCDPPYYVDSSGHLIYKSACFR